VLTSAKVVSDQLAAEMQVRAYRIAAVSSRLNSTPYACDKMPGFSSTWYTRTSHFSDRLCSAKEGLSWPWPNEPTIVKTVSSSTLLDGYKLRIMAP
jgi:hypothetical protein